MDNGGEGGMQKDEKNEDIRRYRKMERGERQTASDWEDGWLDILD